MAGLSEWLQLMLAEITRRQEEVRQDAEEEARRQAAPWSPPPASEPQTPYTEVPEELSERGAAAAPPSQLRRARR
jgi:hypothetical protein